MSVQNLINQGYGGYAGWSDAAADADFNATGGAGKRTGGGSTSSSGNDTNSIINNSISALSQYFPKKVTPYDQVNPFFFDEALARQASEAEYSPYYQELLSDYTSTVERNKSRSQEDLNRTLAQLSAGKEYYMGNERRLLDKSMRSTNEGYAGRGLYMSGARGKDLADLQTQYSADTSNYLTNYNYNTSGAKLGTERTTQDLNTNLANYSRDINREKQTAIEQGVLTRKGEALDEYETGRTRYYEDSLYG